MLIESRFVGVFSEDEHNIGALESEIRKFQFAARAQDESDSTNPSL
jgi:hypothetical protein